MRPLALLSMLIPLLAAPPVTVDEVLTRYVRALGGEQALRRINTRVVRGVIDCPTFGGYGEFLEQARRPNLFVQGYQMERYGIGGKGYDGRAGWIETPEFGAVEVTGARLAELRRAAEFDWPLHLQQLYPSLTVRGRATIEDRPAIELASALPEGGEAHIFFAQDTGLLICVDAPETAHDGSRRVVRITQEDYRPLDGVQVPHTLRLESHDLIWIMRRQVTQNVPVDDTRFSKP